MMTATLSLTLLTTALTTLGAGSPTPPTPPGNPVGLERTVTTPTPGDSRFTLAAQPAVIRIDPGRSGTVQVMTEQPGGTPAAVTLTAEGPSVGSGPEKITAVFGGPSGAALTLTAGTDVPVGQHTITIRGRNADAEHTTQVTVIVERWLLVDDDRSGNNWPANNPDAPDSNADQFARAALTASGRTFEVTVVPYSGSGQDKDEPDGPDAQALSRYSGVLWYTGNTTVHPLTDTDREQLSAYLNMDARRVLLFSPGFVRDGTTNGATPAAPRAAYAPLITGQLGLDQVAFPGAAAFALTGEANTVTSGLTLNVASSVRGVLRPAAGTWALLKEGASVIVSGKANVGARGSSKVVLAALSLSHLSRADAVTLLGKLMTF
ncbi:hypothetical protein [Deinococcus enclensis]|uniref:Uncharacterized protein n=1 Tax=Deinococcus enclensis TaxID=1049582 RepID=A0ABT9MI80_9DEIO|nr:hypothetical protein [Deinococcus enclensis]MDP9766292.1 hypothetical protein [Deinococcus enclensis]